MRILLILTGVFLALSSSNVHADGTAILIAGNAPQHERELSLSAMAASIEAQGGKVLNASFTAKEAALVQKCISNAAPWGCMKATVASKGIDQLVVGSFNTGTSPTGALAIRLSGYLVVSNLDFAIVEERHCAPCTDDMLKIFAGELAQAQFRRLAVVRGRTKIAVRTTPRRAFITFDGEAHGTSNTVISTYPGSHTVRLELDGHHVETRTAEAVDGKTVEVSVTMRSNDDGSTASRNARLPKMRYLAPWIVVGGGAALAIGGGILSAMDEDEVRHGTVVPSYRDTATGGVVLVATGAVAVTVGVAWLIRARKKPVITPVVSYQDGAHIGVAGRF